MPCIVIIKCMTTTLDVCTKSKMNTKNIIYIFLTLTVVSAAVKKSYDGYTLYKIVPKDDSDVKILEEIQAKNVGEFWDEGFRATQEAKVMVAPERREEFVRQLATAKIEAKIIINDIQR